MKGVQEHKTDVASGLVSRKREVTYNRQSKYKVKKKQIYKKNYVADASEEVSSVNTSQFSDRDRPNLNHPEQKKRCPPASDPKIPKKYSHSVNYSDFEGSSINVERANKKRISSKKPFRTASVSAFSSASQSVKKGADYIQKVSYQNQNNSVGESVAQTIEKTETNAVTKVDKLTNSRYFKFSGKASDHVKTSRLATVQAVGRKGVQVVDSAIVNPIVKTAGDDVGGQTVVKSVDVSKNVYTAGKTTGKVGYKTAKTTYKYGKKATSKAAKVTAAAARATTHVAVKSVQTVTSIGAKVGAVVMSNPITAIVAAVFLLIVVIIMVLISSIMGSVTQYSSYGGNGKSETMSVNDYAAVYDYINQAIAQRHLDLFNLQDTWTGFLVYDYKYNAIQDDGSITVSDTYPIADVAPIMAYLNVTYPSYTLTNEIKAEIDNIVRNLYTFDYEIEPYTLSTDHGSGNIETVRGEKITFIITRLNTEDFFENGGYIDSEKMAAYSTVKSYGDRAYFRLYNILGQKNWHDWVSDQYGYTIKARYNADTKKNEYILENKEYCTLEYKNSANETAANLYSPLSGTVSSVTETEDYDKVIVLQDTENDLEFTILADFDHRINLLVGQGDTVTAGQQIATRDYKVYIQCKFAGDPINPMLLMEYYQHTE